MNNSGVNFVLSCLSYLRFNSSTFESGIPKRFRRNDRCVSISAVVSGEAQWQQGPRQLLGETQYYSFLFPPGLGGVAYSIGGDVLWWRRRRKGKLAKMLRN